MGVVVGEHVIDHQDPGEALAGGLDSGGGGVQLLAARQQRRPIAQGPSVVLHMSDFEPIGA